MSFDYVLTLAPRMWEGLQTTIVLVGLAWIVGNLLAVGTAICRVSPNPVWRIPAWIYIQVIRGTPLLVQIYLLYYGLGSVFAHDPAIRHSIFWPYLREGFWYAVVALGISTGAYSGEILRGAIGAVPGGEVEAASALGLRPWQTMWLIRLPRAIQASLPTLGGETILLLKSSALASTVTVLDVMGQAQYARAQTARTYEPLVFAAVIYIVLTIVITRLFAVAERYYGRGNRRIEENVPG